MGIPVIAAVHSVGRSYVAKAAVQPVYFGMQRVSRSDTLEITRRDNHTAAASNRFLPFCCCCNPLMFIIPACMLIAAFFLTAKLK